MKTTDMTPELFDREMQKLLADVQTGASRLTAIDPQFQLQPVAVFYPDGGSEPFPLAVELRRCWNYARGEGPRPSGMQRTIEDLTRLLWCPLAATSYEIPFAWWNTPLGIMARMCEVRDSLDRGIPVSAEHFALIADLTPQRIRQLCASGEIHATKEERPGSSQEQWSISADEAREFLAERN